MTKLDVIQDSGDNKDITGYKKGWMRLTYHLHNQPKVHTEHRGKDGKPVKKQVVYHTRSLRYVHHDEIDRLVMHLQQIHGNNWGSKTQGSPDYHVAWEKHLARV